MVTVGFLGLSTNPQLFPNPMPVAAAVAFGDLLLAPPGVEMPALGREWPTRRQLSCDLKLAANDITGAWIASAVRTIGALLVTFDREFRRLLDRTKLTVLKPV